MNSVTSQFISDHPASLNFAEPEDFTITRRKSGKCWAYYESSGVRIKNEDEIGRLNAIALPPAYRDARFNPDADGHLLAVGYDEKGRRQYRYHPDYRSSQDSQKFALCAEFGRALPTLRRHLDSQLKAHPTSREAVMAAVIRILDTEYLRIGNEAYRRTNKSFGLTTLRNRHAQLRGQSLDLKYRGKGGIIRSVRLNDRSLLRIMRRCQDLPGQNLFQYEYVSGQVRPISSNDINGHLRELMGDNFTAKHFRTWHASVIAFENLQSGNDIKQTLEEVARALGNTPAIARKSYVHPALLQDQSEFFQASRLPRATKWLSRPERGFIDWLANVS